MKRRLLALAAFSAVITMTLAASRAAEPVRLNPATMARTATVDARFQSYNVEAVEVTGGRFWAPYGAKPAAADKTPFGQSVPGLDSMFRQRPPLDLSNRRLRALAAGLGPAYVRVSGSWMNSVYFHDSDEPAPAAPPAGFNSVLTRAQWRGVIDFAKAADAKIVTSFSISAGTRDANGTWTPDQARKLLAFTASIGGSIAAAEFFNEPNVAVLQGAPKGYDAAAYGRDFKVFLPFIRQAAPGLLVLGPGSTSESSNLIFGQPIIKSADMLTASGPGLDAVSYHFYGALSKRCAAFMPGGGTTIEAALSQEWLSKTEKEAAFFASVRDRFEPGKPLWLTETAQTGCGGDAWASQFVDTFRYVEQLGRLAKRNVQVVAHNTLAASDYSLVDEATLEPRPNYWAALLWRKLMGTTVLDAGAASVAGVDLFAHCMPGRPGAVTVLAVNTDRGAGRELAIGSAAERYTLASTAGLQATTVELNGRTLSLGPNDALPATPGEPVTAGVVTLPPASITFLAFANAGNPACR